MLLRGPAIVEGALQIAIAETDVTIHSAEVVVVGFGNVGGLLAATLRAIGAGVTVAARSAVQRAAAAAIGARPLPLEELGSAADRFQMVFSTVPAPVVGQTVLERLPRAALVMDLAAPPGGVDLERGPCARPPRGLGSRAGSPGARSRSAPASGRAFAGASMRARPHQGRSPGLDVR